MNRIRPRWLLAIALRIAIIMIGAVITAVVVLAGHGSLPTAVFAAWAVGIPLALLAESSWLFDKWSDTGKLQRFRQQQLLILVFWLVVLWFAAGQSSGWSTCVVY